MKLFNNPRKTVVLILVVLALFFSYQAWAGEVRVGPTYASGLNGGAALTYSERVLGDRVDVGVLLVSSQRYDKEDLDIGNNGAAYAKFVAHRPATWPSLLPCEVGIGVAHWVETNRFIGDETGFLLDVKWCVGDHFNVGVLHGSNAGIAPPNRGQDILMFGWRF